MTTDKTTENTSSAPQDTWDMASAILVALHQALHQAQAEYLALTENAPDGSIVRGRSAASHLIQTLRPALHQLEKDMRDHARSCGLSMPKLER